MMTYTSLPSVPPDDVVPFTDQVAVGGGCLMARFKGPSRYHSESDLRCYLAATTSSPASLSVVMANRHRRPLTLQVNRHSPD
jgi:hypothetical protein